MPAELYHSGETPADWPMHCGQGMALVTEYEIGAKKPTYSARCMVCGWQTAGYATEDEVLDEVRKQE